MLMFAWDYRIAAWTPYKLQIEPFLSDPTLAYPYKRVETVNAEELYLYSYRIPLAIIVLVGAARLSIHEIHHGILAFLVAFETNDIATGRVMSLHACQ